MVWYNMGLPDPQDHDNSPTSNDNIDYNDVNNYVDLQFDTNDDQYYFGYQQLSAHDNFLANDSDSSTNDDGEDDNSAVKNAIEHEANVSQEKPSDLPPVSSAESTLLKEVWFDTKSKDIEMDSEKVRAVKNAMVNFTLPASSIPEWATNIPEQEWKDHMLQRIQANAKK